MTQTVKSGEVTIRDREVRRWMNLLLEEQCIALGLGSDNSGKRHCAKPAAAVPCKVDVSIRLLRGPYLNDNTMDVSSGNEKF